MSFKIVYYKIGQLIFNFVRYEFVFKKWINIFFCYEIINYFKIRFYFSYGLIKTNTLWFPYQTKAIVVQV